AKAAQVIQKACAPRARRDRKLKKQKKQAQTEAAKCPATSTAYTTLPGPVRPGLRQLRHLPDLHAQRPWRKRFNLPSKLSGLLQGRSSDFGYLLGVLPVSFYGRQAHRPRTMGGLGLLLSLGILIMSSPYYFFGPMPAGSGGSPASQSSSPSAGLLCNSTATTSAAAAAVAADGQQPLSRQSAVAYFVLVLAPSWLASAVRRSGTWPRLHRRPRVKGARPGVHIRHDGPPLRGGRCPGYIIGGQLAMLPESLLSGAPPNTPASAPGGSAFAAAPARMTASRRRSSCPRRSGFPRLRTSTNPDGRALRAGRLQPKQPRPPPQAPRNGDRPTPAVDLLNSVVSLDPASLVKTGLSHTLRRLAGNLTFLALLIGAALEFLAFMGFLAFLPKYYQASEAGLYAGIVEGLSSALGTLGGRHLHEPGPAVAEQTAGAHHRGLPGDRPAGKHWSFAGVQSDTAEFTDFDMIPPPAPCATATAGSTGPSARGNAPPTCHPVWPAARVFHFTTRPRVRSRLRCCPSFEGCGCDAVASSSSPTASRLPASSPSTGFCDGGGVGGGCSARPHRLQLHLLLPEPAGWRGEEHRVRHRHSRPSAPRDKDIGFGFITFAASFSSTISPILYGAMIDAFCLHPRRPPAAVSSPAACCTQHRRNPQSGQHLLRSRAGGFSGGLAFVVATRNEREIKNGNNAAAGGGGGSSNGASAAPQEAG
uniref:MFS domain-containing protein n=1 Tax=Macrostomum lignano TaxID=282301 RepID=A0A1I8FU69_9PLAT